MRKSLVSLFRRLCGNDDENNLRPYQAPRHRRPTIKLDPPSEQTTVPELGRTFDSAEGYGPAPHRDLAPETGVPNPNGEIPAAGQLKAAASLEVGIGSVKSGRPQSSENPVAVEHRQTEETGSVELSTFRPLGHEPDDARLGLPSMLRARQPYQDHINANGLLESTENAESVEWPSVCGQLLYDETPTATDLMQR